MTWGSSLEAKRQELAGGKVANRSVRWCRKKSLRSYVDGARLTLLTSNYLSSVQPLIGVLYTPGWKTLRVSTFTRHIQDR
jgi:hypothetical protein